MKRQNVDSSEAEGLVADSIEIRTKLMEQIRNGEKILSQVQAELKKIQRDAKKNGKITRSQAYNQG